MNKTEFVSAVAERSGIDKKTVDTALKSAIAVIEEALAEGDKIQLTGFGTFDVRKNRSRTGLNPRTGEPLKILPSKTPTFKPGQTFKAYVNK